MRIKEEIIRRAVCLLCFADRCSLEDTVFDGIRRSLSERENQRKTIIRWLEEKEYYDFLTEKEKSIMETTIVKATNNEAYMKENDYECISPLIWSLGLIDELPDYNGFVLDDLHAPLKIGANHTLDKLAESCEIISPEKIQKQREIAMLWYWRCLEGRHASDNNIDYLRAIEEIFGQDHSAMLKDYPGFDVAKGDFIVKGKTVGMLHPSLMAALEVYAERRFYAFEWLCSEADWDEVDLVC